MFGNVLCYNETRVLILEPLPMFDIDSCFPCAKDLVLLKVLLSLTDINLEDTYVAFFRNAQCVSLTKMLVGMYVNNFFTWKMGKMRTYVYHLWLQNCTLRTLTTSLCGKGL